MTDAGQSQAMPGRGRAMTFASLPDEVIRRVRMGVMFLTGTTAAVVGAGMLLSSAIDVNSWERVNALTWVVCASSCYATLAVTRTTLIRLSEVMLVLTAYFCTASIVITGSPLSSVVLGASAYALVVLLPGIAFRTRSFRASAYNVAAVGLIYILSVASRMWLHEQSGLDSWSEFVIKLFIPPIAFWVEWFMVRALNQCILEALQESERSRNKQ